MKRILMSKGARTIVETCANVQPGEEVLIIYEARMKSIAYAVSSAVIAASAEPITMAITPRRSDGEEPPSAVAAAMEKCDVFISAVYTSITHTRAVKNAVNAGARGILMTQFTENILIGGGIDADFPSIAPKCKNVANRLENTKEVVLTTPLGTNLTFSAENRRGNALYCMVEPGQFSTVPTIEANVSPLEGTANGVIVADASIPYIGIGVLDEPVTLTVENGYVTGVNGGKQAKILEEDWKLKDDPEVYNIAEMGIGLNPKCSFQGIMLEDEGVYGAVHIGIGTSITLGGTVKAKSHYDVIMTKPTVVLDGKVLLENGKLCL